MRRNQSPLEDFTDIMTRLPWWLNIILAFISYAVLHKLAMHFYDPAPQNLDVGNMGEYMASKIYPSIALFGQFAIPFAFILAGFLSVVKKTKRTRSYKELLLFIAIVGIIFGSIMNQSGGVHESMMDRVKDPNKKEISQKIIFEEEKPSTEAENELKALQGILNNLRGEQPKQEGEKIYTWINEKGNRVYSNTPRQE